MGRLRKISEQVFEWVSFSGIRSTFRVFGQKFWPSHPIDEGTLVNYDLCRQIYRNNGQNNLGAGFGKPIVDTSVNFIGMPLCSTDNEDTTAYLNECVLIYWAEQLQEMFRDALRDSKVVVRITKPDVLDPLMTMDEAEHCRIECIPPERVEIERNFANKNIIERALIHTRMVIVTDPGNPTNGTDPQTEEHEILEIITRDSFRFFDQNTNQYITDLARPNPWNFVPVCEVYNEWDSALQSGQSEYENVIPFLNAFHDILVQSLEAHRYHSTPKVKFKINDVASFIKNNFPAAVDENGQIRPQSEVSWRGREILFFAPEEDGEFMQIKSVLGDSKTLLEFLLDCICIASQTPEWAFMRVDSGSANSDRNAQTVPLLQKIERKRRMFAAAVQAIAKMALVIEGQIPVRPRISWQVIRADDQFITMQAFQQLVMGLEVARQSGEISDETYVQAIASFLPHMDSPSKELAQAQAQQQKRVADAQKAMQVAATAPNQQPQNGNVPIGAGPQGKNE